VSAWDGTGEVTNVTILRPGGKHRRPKRYYLVRTLVRAFVYAVIVLALVALTSEWGFVR
jgi:hypothetical protein